MQAKIAAFGSTRRAKVTPDQDENLLTLIDADPDTVTIFGKTWDFHVREALRISLDQNLELIYDSLEFLKKNIPEVVYDAEHFFDGYKANPEYAIKTLQAAQDAKVDCIVLCDTNGGSMPFEVAAIMEEIKSSSRFLSVSMLITTASAPWRIHWSPFSMAPRMFRGR